uniref:Uncharacterized protein n=1 Tax=Setaria digitata TaxID=48799 RepID=A0A915PVN1_9BILA
MAEDGKNVSDDMSSLLNAAEKWANEKIYDSHPNNLDDPHSYPVYVPIEEVAREVALKICQIYNWNPETGADSRLPEQNAGDIMTPYHLSLPLCNTPDNTAILSTSKLEGNASTMTPNSSISTMQQQRHRSVIELSAANKHILNKTFIIRGNATKKHIMKESGASDRLAQKNASSNETDSSAQSISLNDKTSALFEAEKCNISRFIEQNGNKISNSDGSSENKEKKLVSDACEKSLINPVLQNPLSSLAVINYQQIHDNNFITKVSDTKSQLLTTDDPKWKDFNTRISTANENIGNVSVGKDAKTETIVEVMPSSLLSSSDGPVKEDERESDALKAVANDTLLMPINNATSQKFRNSCTENEKNSSTNKTMEIFFSSAPSQSDPINDIDDKNHISVAELEEKLRRLQIRNTSSSSVRKLRNQHSAATDSTTGTKRLTVAKKPFISRENFKNSALITPSRSASSVQTEPIGDISSSKRYANVELSVQKLLRTGSKQTDSTVNVMDGSFVTENQTTVVDSISLPFENAIPERKSIGFDTSLLAMKKHSEDTTMEQVTTRNVTCGKRSYLLDEPIKFFNYMTSPTRRRSLLTPRSTTSFNISTKSATNSNTLRRRTIRETVYSTPTVTHKFIRNASTKASDAKQLPKLIHSIRSINPSKKPNELPLENRASRLKAEYLAKQRAERDNEIIIAAAKSKMNAKLTPVITGRLSVIEKSLPSMYNHFVKSNNIKKSNIGSDSKVNRNSNDFGRSVLLSINEVSPIPNEKCTHKEKNLEVIWNMKSNSY